MLDDDTLPILMALGLIVLAWLAYTYEDSAPDSEVMTDEELFELWYKK